MKKALNVGREADPARLPDDQEEITWHGKLVTRILHNHTENIRFNFFRVLHPRQGHPAPQRAVQRGIHLADLHDMDVLNLSLGNDHTDDGNIDCIRGNQNCKVRDMIENAISDDIFIISASGNKGDDEHLVCPGRSEESITVGGFKSLCRAEVSEESIAPTDRMNLRPPNACWVEDSDGERSEILCSGNRCSPFHSCKNNRADLPADTNLPPVGNKPDVLAPSVLFNLNDGGPKIFRGSSWAVPYVTACVAECLSSLDNIGESATRNQMKKALRTTARPLDDGSDRMLYGIGMFEHIARKKGYNMDVEPPDHIEWQRGW